MDKEADTKRLLARREYARLYYRARKDDDPTYNTGHTRPRSEAQWDWHIKDKYGVTSQQVADMFERQAGACAICGSSLFDTCHIDHCHITGNVRGLLCRACNHGLGNFNDSPEALVAAANYLTNFKDYHEDQISISA